MTALSRACECEAVSVCVLEKNAEYGHTPHFSFADIRTRKSFSENIEYAACVFFLGSIGYVARAKLDNFTSLVGCFCGVPLAFIYPAVVDLLYQRRSRGRGGSNSAGSFASASVQRVSTSSAQSAGRQGVRREKMVDSHEHHRSHESQAVSEVTQSTEADNLEGGHGSGSGLASSSGIASCSPRRAPFMSSSASSDLGTVFAGDVGAVGGLMATNSGVSASSSAEAVSRAGVLSSTVLRAPVGAENSAVGAGFGRNQDVDDRGPCGMADRSSSASRDGVARVVDVDAACDDGCDRTPGQSGGDSGTPHQEVLSPDKRRIETKNPAISGVLLIVGVVAFVGSSYVNISSILAGGGS